MVTGVWSKEGLSLIKKDEVREYLSKLEKHKFISPDAVHQQVLRHLDYIIVRLLDNH